jgi:hypothetical protein
MKYIKLFEDFSQYRRIKGVTLEQQEFLYHCLGALPAYDAVKVNSDGSVDVDSDLWMAIPGLKKFPIKFNIVTGDFFCRDQPLLETLEGAPNIVHGDFNCDNCPKLVSLEGGPSIVTGSYSCIRNHFKDLKGSAQKVGYDFDCSHNPQLKSIEGGPDFIEGTFIATETGLPPEQLAMIDKFDLYIEWKESKLSLEQFLHKKRGTVKGIEFGF